jgi:hypothetical protein
MSRSSAGGRSNRGESRHESPSPPSRRPCHREGGRQVIVERLVEKSTAGIVYLMLTRTNYTEWNAVMRVNLQVAGLWEAVRHGGVEYRDDRLALAARRAVSAEMQSGLANKETACEAWESIRRIRVGADRVKEANEERLRQEFAEIKFKPGEGVEDFSLRITALANELRVLGDGITDKEVVKKILHSVPEKLEQVAISMETLLDLNSLSIEEAASHLRAVEQRKKSTTPPTAEAGGQLLLTEEEWMARMKAKAKGKGSTSGTGGSNGGSGRGRSRGKDHGGGRGARGDGAGRDACHNCGKIGHWAHECRSRPKKEEAHAAQDEESSLLSLEAVGEMGAEILSPPLPVMPPHAGPLGDPTALSTEDEIDYINTSKIPPHTTEILHIADDKVFAQFSEEEKEGRRWVLDTGATNHMTGCRSAFSDLNRNIQGTVKFGDGSVVQIEGVGTILFSCKNGEHRAFVDVYFIPKLNTNIISIGQLDKAGFQTNIDGGVLRIRDVQRRLLAKVHRSPN